MHEMNIGAKLGRRGQSLVNLRNLDLNLLLVFEAISRERSVIRAANRLHLSQPAMSHALSRLRDQLGDQLFVRTPGGMMPTPRAEQLAAPVRRALDELQLALEPEAFSPASAERRFVIAVNNYAAAVLVAPLIAKCRALAPGIRLSLRPSGTLNLTDLLERSELDLAVSTIDASAERFASQALIEDRYVLVMRRGHPAAQDHLDVAGFVKLPQLVISSSGDDMSFVDSALAAQGAARSIMLEVPYLSSGLVLRQSGMVAVLGRQIA